MFNLEEYKAAKAISWLYGVFLTKGDSFTGPSSFYYVLSMCLVYL